MFKNMFYSVHVSLQTGSVGQRVDSGALHVMKIWNKPAMAKSNLKSGKVLLLNLNAISTQ